MPSRNRFASLVFLFFCSAPAWSTGQLQVDLDPANGRISIKADDVALPTLLSRISQATGIDFQVDPSLSGNIVSVMVDSTTIDSGLRQLLRRYNYVLEYSYGSDGASRIHSAQVFVRGAPDPARKNAVLERAQSITVVGVADTADGIPAFVAPSTSGPSAKPAAQEPDPTSGDDTSLSQSGLNDMDQVGGSATSVSKLQLRHRQGNSRRASSISPDEISGQ